MPNEPVTIDQVFKMLGEAIDDIVAKLGPKSDICPHMFFYDCQQGGADTGIMPCPQMAGSNQEKELIAQVVIPAVMQQTRPKTVAFVTAAWKKTYPNTPEGKAEQATDEATHGKGRLEKL